MIKYIITVYFLINLIIAKQLSHLNDLKWKNRILVVLYDNEFQFFKNIKQNIKGLDERNFVIISFHNARAFIDEKPMSEKFSRSVSQKIKNINPNHRLILIGKDGSIKSSYLFETELEKIFYDVDKMPMRKYEMKIRNKS